jgi:hypothetical protein
MSTQEYQTAEIIVKAVYPPKPGKQVGTLKTAEGELYGVWPDKLGLFQPGQRYTVQYVDRPYKGKNYRSITKRLAAPAVQATPENTTPSSPRQFMGEEQFVAHLLAASLQSQMIELNDRDLTRATSLFQTVYRQMLLKH